MADSLWVPDSARRSAGMSPASIDLDTNVRKALELGRTGATEDREVIREMRHNRQVNSRFARTSAMGGGGPDLSFATARPRDPMFYFRQNNPYDVRKHEELKKLRAFFRLVYMSHPVIGSAIDIYSKYPLTGMELRCKDEALTEFYSTLFLEQLDYPHYLKRVLREYWTVGEAWPFGSFNEMLGVWEDDELLDPDDIEVERSPFLKDPRFLMRLPETLRRVLTEKKPEWEYKALVRSYPELQHFLGDKATMPVSNNLLRQIKFDADTFNPRGVPILMRAMRALIQEEMLNSAQDSISDRLSTPLLVAKLGASATDLGTQTPWIPTEGDLMNFEEALDMALAADFRVLTHHFGLKIETAFGREVMPNFDPDFERLEGKELQAFGLSKTMISGAAGGETYAADALNRDLISQLLGDAQDLAVGLYKHRALIVAEAQEHFDFEVRNGKRYVIMEEVLEVDEETGEKRIVEQPKLLIPDMRIRAMNMQDENNMRQLVEAWREAGIPISQKTRLVNFDIDLEEEREAVIEEQVEQAVDAATVERKTYEALRDDNLPIPPALEAKFRPHASTAEGNPHSQVPPSEPIPTLGTSEPTDDVALVPDASERDMAGEEDAGAPSNVIQLPQNKIMQRPVESDEMRAGMPRSSVRYEDTMGYEREVTEGAMIMGPKHIGMRRHANVNKDVPLGDDKPDANTG